MVGSLEGNKRQDNRYNKSDDFIAGITNVYVNVRGGCMSSRCCIARVVRNSESLRGLDLQLGWVTSLAGIVAL